MSIAPPRVLISGPLRALQAHQDGSWTVVPQYGRPLRITDTGATVVTGPAARMDGVCGCTAATPDAEPPAREHDMALARAISGHLAALGVATCRRSVSFDPDRSAVVVRVASEHGLCTLPIPPEGRLYAVEFNGRHSGSLDGVRRTAGSADALAGRLLAAHLRDRGDL
jgi:hypothetical protein